MKPDILVISLPEHKRRKSFYDNWKNISIDYKFFDAVNGWENKKDTPISSRFNRVLRPGEIGCVESHRAIWKKYQDNPEGVIIFEDDLLPNNNSDNIYLYIETAKTIKDLEFLYLAQLRGTQETNHTECKNIELCKTNYPFWGTGAYWISPEGMKRCLSLTENLDTAADWIYYDMPIGSYYHLSYACCFTAELYANKSQTRSNIEKDEFEQPEIKQSDIIKKERKYGTSALIRYYNDGYTVIQCLESIRGIFDEIVFCYQPHENGYHKDVLEYLINKKVESLKDENIIFVPYHSIPYKNKTYDINKVHANYTMANYSNYALLACNYSRVIKIDTDQIYFNSILKNVVEKNVDPKNIVYPYGINYFLTPDGKEIAPCDNKFNGFDGDTLFIDFTLNPFFKQTENWEYLSFN